MPPFLLRHPFFIIVICLFVCALGLTSLIQMPVNMFPPVNIPVVMVATFYNGISPKQIKANATDTFERFSNVSRSEGRGLKRAIVHACRIRLRPILITSLAAVVGLLPMAFNIGGLISSIILTIFVVPAAYLLMHRRRAYATEAIEPSGAD